MADDNKINYDTELTPEEKEEVQAALNNLNDQDVQDDEDFIKDVYGQADNDMNEVYKSNNENKKSILDKISKVLLYYTIANETLKLSNSEYKSLFSDFSKTIAIMFKSHAKLTHNVMENTLNNVANKILDKYNIRKTQKDREKLVNQLYHGKHFSERIWENEQKVAKQIQLEIKNLLKGKVSANQIAKRIQLRFNSNEYNAKRLADTEISRIQNELFRQNCHETGAKYVLYRATFCRSCLECLSHHNITYKLENAPMLPIHPSCRCYYTIVDNPTKAMNLQLFSSKSDVQKVLNNIENNKIPKKEFYESLKYFNKQFKNGVKTPVDIIRNSDDRYYHIIAGHLDLLGKEEVNNIIQTLKEPDVIKKSIDRNGRESIGYLKEIAGFTLLVIAKNDIITAYYPGKNYLKNKVESWDTIWQKK